MNRTVRTKISISPMPDDKFDKRFNELNCEIRRQGNKRIFQFFALLNNVMLNVTGMSKQLIVTHSLFEFSCWPYTYSFQSYKFEHDCSV